MDHQEDAGGPLVLQIHLRIHLHQTVHLASGETTVRYRTKPAIPVSTRADLTQRVDADHLTDVTLVKGKDPSELDTLTDETPCQRTSHAVPISFLLIEGTSPARTSVGHSSPSGRSAVQSLSRFTWAHLLALGSPAAPQGHDGLKQLIPCSAHLSRVAEACTHLISPEYHTASNYLQLRRLYTCNYFKGTSKVSTPGRVTHSIPLSS